jgi:hypothetical protein
MMLRKPCVLVFVITFALIQNRPAFAQDTGEPQKQEQGTQQPPVQDPAQVVRPSETVRTPSTGRRIFTNVWSDQKAMWRSRSTCSRRTGSGGGCLAARLPH